MAKIPRLKYSYKKEKDKKGKEGYRYTGKQKDGTTFTSKLHSTEQSARGDVSDQRYKHWLKKKRKQMDSSSNYSNYQKLYGDMLKKGKTHKDYKGKSI
jgi:hypothetical protein